MIDITKFRRAASNWTRQTRTHEPRNPRRAGAGAYSAPDAAAETAAKELAQRIARDDAQDARTFADLTALLSPAGLKPSEFPTLEEVRSGRKLNLSAIGIHSATAHDLTRPFSGEPTGLIITINTAGALIQIVKILTAERGISRAS